MSIAPTSIRLEQSGANIKGSLCLIRHKIVGHEENNYTIEHIETIVGRETNIETFSTTVVIISSMLFLTAVYYQRKKK